MITRLFKNKILLLIIVVIATFLRFYQLGTNPPSLTWDEAALGYNAYSLGLDGKDEFGRFLPYDYLESFGDFKPPVYAYLDIIPIKIFGLNEFAVRFPSAFFGVLTVLITYFLVLRIFNNRKWEIGSGKVDKEVGSENKRSHFSPQFPISHLALLTSFLLAISPWHINLSRAAFEANIATFFIVTGVWLFLTGVQKSSVPGSNKKWFLVLSAVSFALSIYTFNSARIVALILIFILATGFRHSLFRIKKQVLVACIIGFLFILPTLNFLLSPQASLRFREVNIFSDISIIERTNQEIANDNNARWSKIIHNRRFAYGVEFLKHYFDNLNPDFLFIKGDGNPKFSTRDVGQLYIWEIPFLIAGILFLVKNRQGVWWIIPLWLLAGIIPAATARETPHALRIEATLPTFQILVAYGIAILFKRISNIQFQISNFKLNRLVFCAFIFVVIINFLYYIHGYYAHYPKQYSGEWQYGYKDAISYVKNVEKNYDRIYFTEALGRPYVYFLFYTNYSPEEFRKSSIVEREVLGFVHVNGFDKYRFAKNITGDNESGRKILYIDVPNSVPINANIQKEFYLLNGEKVLAAYIL